MQNACRQHRLRECQLRSRVFSTGYNISALGYFGRHFKPNNCNWLTLLAFPSATARFIKLAVCLQILHQHNLRSACCLFVRAPNPPNIMLNCRKMLNCKQFFFLSKLFNFIFLLELFFMHTLLQHSRALKNIPNILLWYGTVQYWTYRPINLGYKLELIGYSYITLETYNRVMLAWTTDQGRSVLMNFKIM